MVKKFKSTFALTAILMVTVLLAGCIGGGTKTFTLTVNIEPEGAAEVKDLAKKYDKDSIAEFALEAAEGYEFVEWTGEVKPVEKDGKWTIVMDGDKTLTAVFKEIEEEPEPEVTVKAVAALDDISAAFGTDFAELKLPAEVEVTLSDDTKVNAAVEWAKGDFDGETTGVYTLTGTLTMPEGVTNPDGLTASIKVIVGEDPAEVAKADAKTTAEKAFADIIVEVTEENLKDAKDAVDAGQAAVAGAVEAGWTAEEVALFEGYGKIAEAKTAIAEVEATIDYAGLVAEVEAAVKAYEGLAEGNLSTQELIDAANAAKADIDLAGLTDEDKAEFQARIDAADASVEAAQAALNYAALVAEVEAAVKAYEGLAEGDLSTQELIDAANAAKADIDLAGLTDEDKAEFQARIDAADALVEAAQAVLDDEELAEAIAAAVAKIDTLGKPTELTFDDEAEVLDARALADKAFDLGAEEADIVNYDVLLSAEKVIEGLRKALSEKETAIQDANTAITRLPLAANVTLDHKDAVVETRELVNKAFDLGAEEADIKNIWKLEEAEAKIAELEAADLAAAVKAAEEAVEAVETKAVEVEAAAAVYSEEYAGLVEDVNGLVETAEAKIALLPEDHEAIAELEGRLAEVATKLEAAAEVYDAYLPAVEKIEFAEAAIADLSSQAKIDAAQGAHDTALEAVETLNEGDVQDGLLESLEGVATAITEAQVLLDGKYTEVTEELFNSWLANQDTGIAEVVDEDLQLPSRLILGDNVFDIVWESSNPDVISSEGVVTPSKDTNEEVTLTATLSYAGEVTIQTLEVEVVRSYDTVVTVKAQSWIDLELAIDEFAKTDLEAMKYTDLEGFYTEKDELAEEFGRLQELGVLDEDDESSLNGKLDKINGELDKLLNGYVEAVTGAENHFELLDALEKFFVGVDNNLLSKYEEKIESLVNPDVYDIQGAIEAGNKATIDGPVVEAVKEAADVSQIALYDVLGEYGFDRVNKTWIALYAGIAKEQVESRDDIQEFIDNKNMEEVNAAIDALFEVGSNRKAIAVKTDAKAIADAEALLIWIRPDDPKNEEDTKKADMVEDIEKAKTQLEAFAAVEALVDGLFVMVDDEEYELAEDVDQEKLDAIGEKLGDLVEGTRKTSLIKKLDKAQTALNARVADANYKAAKKAVYELFVLDEDGNFVLDEEAKILADSVDQTDIGNAQELLDVEGVVDEDGALQGLIGEAQELLNDANFEAAKKAVYALFKLDEDGNFVLDEEAKILADSVDQTDIDNAQELLDVEGVVDEDGALQGLIDEAKELLDTAAINTAIQNNDAVTLQAIIVEYGTSDFNNLTRAQREELVQFIIDEALAKEKYEPVTGTDAFEGAISGDVTKYKNAIEEVNTATTNTGMVEALVGIHYDTFDDLTDVQKLNVAEKLVSIKEKSFTTFAEIIVEIDRAIAQL